MRAKLNAMGQITLPKEILDRLPRTDDFDVVLVEGAIVLRPTTGAITALERVRGRMRDIGRSEMIVHEAVSWARTS